MLLDDTGNKLGLIWDKGLRVALTKRLWLCHSPPGCWDCDADSPFPLSVLHLHFQGTKVAGGLGGELSDSIW